MNNKSGFRKLMEFSHEKAIADLGDYYIVPQHIMDNQIHCLETGATEIQRLTADVARLKDENAELLLRVLAMPDDTDPLLEEMAEALGDLLLEIDYNVDLPLAWKEAEGVLQKYWEKVNK